MNIVETEAIVLYTRDYGESDRLISLYTRMHGRLKGIAKGARRSRKRFVHTFEPCSLVELKYRERKSLIWIEACKLIEPHLALRTDFERWGYAALVSEIILEMVPEGDHQPELFFLLKDALTRLTEDRDPLNVVLLFLFRFLDIMGYLPALEHCSTCQRPLKKSVLWWWHTSQGALTCAEHHVEQGDQIELDLGTLVLIHRSRLLASDKVWRLRFVQGKRIPLLNGLLDWIRGHIRKDLKSLKVLEQVQSA